MGNLKPGATLIYERDKGVVYSREFGSHPNTRVPVGWDYDRSNPTFNPTVDYRSEGQQELDDHNEWIKIRLAGKGNPALQKAIERVKILYKLSQEKYE
jgi:hypothetical protein